MSITEAHIAHYREHGYAIVENFLTPDELEGARAEIDVRLPGWLDYADDSSRPKPDGWDQPRSSRRTGRFPFAGTHLNAITLHPKLHAFAAEMAGHDDLHCEQSDLSYKCKDHPGDRDQAMHCDYRNHTLAYPPDDPAYWQTAYLLYYTDVDEYHAPTAVCSRQHYPEKLLWPSSYTREERPALYENEVKVVVPAGSLFAYSVRTFHRGTAFQHEGARVAQFITYAPAAWKWLGIIAWSEEAVRPEFTAWIESATPEERETLGFPAPGHTYWTEETLAGVGARYPGMDLSPYRNARDDSR